MAWGERRRKCKVDNNEFRINGSGNPEASRIMKGSGHSILDSAARETVVKASPFPAADNTVEVPITLTFKNNN